MLGIFSVFGQKNAATCETLSKINTLLQREHYHPKPVDDSLSVYVFDTFIDGLDPDRNLFTKIEYEKLSQYRLKIDDAILTKDCSFFTDFVSLYQSALQRRKAVIDKVEKLPFDYYSNDSVKFSKKAFPFDLSENDLERVWKKRLRFEILEEIAGMSDNLDSLNRNFPAIEKEVRARNYEANLCKINSILGENDLETHLQGDLFNAFCSYFDPHSNYFTVDEKSSYMSALSTSNLSVGLDFEMNEKQEIVVAEVIPGGPAARSEQIQKNDVIVKVSNKNGIEYSTTCASPYQISTLIYSDENKHIAFTIRKKSGALLEVDLEKQLMKAVSSSVYSFIAEKNGVRTGYIKIPSFYSDFENNMATGCADDVAKEVEKLKRDGISGIVIDLQDNGGGSMDEAIKLAGMFIDSGPISILSDRENRQEIIRDNNRGLIYDGPLVLEVNGNSASASEFFVAAMQDYKRAIVTGTTTLGKASMQSILPVENNSDKDFVKVTLEKFYRITGDSHQRKGIVPDIMMPVLFDSLVPREKMIKTALEYDRIDAKIRIAEFPASGREKAIFMSNQRIKNDTVFNMLKEINKEIYQIYNREKMPIALTLDCFFEEAHENEMLSEKVKKIAEKNNDCSISNTAFEKENVSADAYLKEINDYEINDVKHNLYLGECINIIRDWNGLKK